jgi:diphosphomevalonate decarboxylase
MKATAKSPANIAFIKYWGKTDSKTRVPENNSISMCLSDLFSICTVEFRQDLKKDEVVFKGEKVVTEREKERIVGVLDRARSLGKTKLRARVVTENNFPKATGIASSASGLSAVTVAALGALGVELRERELSKLARLASGTACRSMADGWVEWEKGTNADNSFAKQIFPVDWWQITDVVAIVTNKMKKVSSTEGHGLAETSPFYKARIKGMREKISSIKQAIRKRDLAEFGRIVEDEALNMHAVCLTSQPPIVYWNETTIKIMREVMEWREEGDLESYFTIDAGSSVHVICRKRDAQKAARKLRKIEGVKRVVVNNPGIGARLLT